MLLQVCREFMMVGTYCRVLESSRKLVKKAIYRASGEAFTCATGPREGAAPEFGPLLPALGIDPVLGQGTTDMFKNAWSTAMPFATAFIAFAYPPYLYLIEGPWHLPGVTSVSKGRCVISPYCLQG